MLSRQGGADLIQLLNFARHSAQPFVYLLTHVDQVNVVESIVNRALQQWERSVRWQVCVDQRIEPWIVKATVCERNQPQIGAAKVVVVREKQRLVSTDQHSFEVGRQFQRAFKRNATKAREITEQLPDA